MVLVEGLILPTLVFGSTVSVSALQPVLASSDWLRAVPLFASIPLSCVKKNKLAILFVVIDRKENDSSSSIKKISERGKGCL